MSSLLTPKKIATILLSVLAVMFFVTTQWLIIGTNHSVSPDEAANLLFAERVAAGKSIAIDVPVELAEAGDNGIRPRSTVGMDGRVVPTSFLGVPILYGAVGWIFGAWIIPHLTSVIAILGAVAWALLIRYLAKSEAIGWLAGALVLVTPGYWFYTGRALMHNVPFVAFLMIAAWIGIVRPLGKWSAPLAGLTLGIGMTMRTGEIIWVTALVASLVVIALIKRLWSLKDVAGFVLAGLVVAISLGIAQQNVYGSFFETGYTIQPSYEVSPQEPPAPPTEVTQANYSGVLGVLFPFGFHERAIVRNGWNYLIELPLLYSGVAAAGVLIVVLIAARKFWQQGIKRGIESMGAWEYLAMVLFAVTAWLVAVYGSWVFFDNADRDLITVGNSYVRYWLPIYLLMTPFIALALRIGWDSTGKIAKGKDWIAKPIWGIIMAICFLGSSLITVFDSDDGFANARSVLIDAETQVQQVLENTEEDAVVIVDTEDKYLYPERQVLVPLRTERTYALMPRIAKVAPLYYYGISLPEKDLDFLNTEKLAQNDLQIELVEVIDDKSLYRITFTSE